MCACVRACVRACALGVWYLLAIPPWYLVRAAARPFPQICVSLTGPWMVPPLCAQGFDEYMNLTLDEAEEHDVANDTRTKIGRILLKGDNVSLMQAV